mmetsp:Transcript_116191/g.217518  ORF Transcript_116191/g.217518 Transcript_116191/m.217518 type:complete len:209 (+) Transcript_116191:163-789(+)
MLWTTLFASSTVAGASPGTSCFAGVVSCSGWSAAEAPSPGASVDLASSSGATARAAAASPGTLASLLTSLKLSILSELRARWSISASNLAMRSSYCRAFLAQRASNSQSRKEASSALHSVAFFSISSHNLFRRIEDTTRSCTSGAVPSCRARCPYRHSSCAHSQAPDMATSIQSMSCRRPGGAACPKPSATPSAVSRNCSLCRATCRT